MKKQRVLHGDCFEVLKTLPDNSVDAIISDPPYGLGTIKSVKKLLKAWMRGEDGTEAVGKGGFMGRSWDACVPPPHMWREVLRVLKPGGHLLIFAGTRTQDLMGMSLRLAGAQPRNAVAWMYGSGMPKSVNIGKEIDRTLGAKRKKMKIPLDFVRNTKSVHGGHGVEGGDRPWLQKARETGYHETDDSTPITPEAAQWQGWGSDLKPAYETVLVYQKPGNFIEEFYNAIVQSESRLWLLLHASTVKRNSKLRTVEKELNIAQWTACEFTNIQDALNAATDTSQLKSKATINWNIVSSWKNILEDVLKLPKTSTIRTELETTTDWKILNSCRLLVMRHCITPESNTLDGHNVAVEIAVDFLCGTLMKWKTTLELSAVVNAMSLDAGYSPVKDDNYKPVLIFRKPISEKTLAANILKWGTGGINIDASRIALSGEKNPSVSRYESVPQKGNHGWEHKNRGGNYGAQTAASMDLGRFPANVILEHHPDCEFIGTKEIGSGDSVKFNKEDRDICKGVHKGYQRPNASMYVNKKAGQLSGYGAQTVDVYKCHPDCPVKALDDQSGYIRSGGSGKAHTRSASVVSPFGGGGLANDISDAGAASRFFYVAKASTEERSLGLETPNDHPTLKPIELMRYLVRMVTPKGGVVLDPFCGSGSTGCACAVEGAQFIGIELDEKFVEVSKKRIAYFHEHRREFRQKAKVLDAAKDVKATPKFTRILFGKSDD